MKNHILVIALLALCASSAVRANAGHFDDLVGEYALDENGRLVEFIRIEQQKQKYVLYRKKGEGWLGPVEITPISRTGIEAILKRRVDIAFEGLGNDTLAVFRVPKGWTLDTFVCHSGYWVATVLGPAELQKL